MIEPYMGPTARFAGSNPERQSIGLPGHCVACAEHGHVAAHPELGCGDVGCTPFHDEAAPASETAPETESALDRAVRETVEAMPPIPEDVKHGIARLLTRAWSQSRRDGHHGD